MDHPITVPPPLAAPAAQESGPAVALAYEGQLHSHMQRWIQIVALLAIVVGALEIGASVIAALSVFGLQSSSISFFSSLGAWATILGGAMFVAATICASAMVVGAIACLRGRDRRRLAAFAALGLVICVIVRLGIQIASTLLLVPGFTSSPANVAEWLAIMLLYTGELLAFPLLVFLLLLPRRGEPPIPFLR